MPQLFSFSASGRQDDSAKVEAVTAQINKEDQEAFDRLFDLAKLHTHAAVYQAHSFPMETILLSICLDHEKIIEEILRKLKLNPA